jgi:hypothetical protein
VSGFHWHHTLNARGRLDDGGQSAVRWISILCARGRPIAPGAPRAGGGLPTCRDERWIAFTRQSDCSHLSESLGSLWQLQALRFERLRELPQTAFELIILKVEDGTAVVLRVTGVDDKLCEAPVRNLRPHLT